MSLFAEQLSYGRPIATGDQIRAAYRDGVTILERLGGNERGKKLLSADKYKLAKQDLSAYWRMIHPIHNNRISIHYALDHTHFRPGPDGLRIPVGPHTVYGAPVNPLTRACELLIAEKEKLSYSQAEVLAIAKSLILLRAYQTPQILTPGSAEWNWMAGFIAQGLSKEAPTGSQDEDWARAEKYLTEPILLFP
jgi:hypothetical protein